LLRLCEQGNEHYGFLQRRDCWLLKQDFFHTHLLPRLVRSWNNRAHERPGTSWLYDSTRLWKPLLHIRCKSRKVKDINFYIRGSVHRNSRLKNSNEIQQYADIYLLLNYSTCFGRPSRLSSGLHKTVVAECEERETSNCCILLVVFPLSSYFAHDARSQEPEVYSCRLWYRLCCKAQKLN
jgi:hypothetical protein